MLVEQESVGMEPSPADYIFVLPKLIWPKPLGKARWKTRVKNINERMALAQQGKWKTLLGKWKTLLELSMKLPLPTYEPTPEEELLDEHGLSQEMASRKATGRQSMETNALSTSLQDHQRSMGRGQGQAQTTP